MPTGVVRTIFSMFSCMDKNTMDVFISPEVQSQNDIKDYGTKGKDCDVSIVVEGRKVKAHKAVLAASIPYFHSMFMLGMKESKMDEVEMPGVEYETMKQLIEYAYTGKMEITTDNVQSIITSAHYLQLTDLVDYCSWFLTRQIDQNNCFDIWRLFKQLALNTELIQIMNDNIMSSFLSISKQDGFIELDIDELVELLSCDQLYTDNEYDVLDRSMLWLRAKQGRQQYIERISQCIRIPSANQLIMGLLDGFTSSPPHPVPFTTRPYKQWILTVAPYGSSQRVQIYDPITRRYQLIKDIRIKQKKDINSILCYKRQVVVVFDPLHCVPTIEIFDLDTREWTKLPKIDGILDNVRAVVVGNKLYLIGTKRCDTTEVEIFDFKTKKWSRGTGSNIDSRKLKVVAIGRYIYVVNHNRRSRLNNCVERYDTEQDIWETVAPMLYDRDKLDLTAHKGKIYVAGEVTQRDGTVTRAMEVYDPDRNTWTELRTNYQPKYLTSLVSTHEGIYAVAAGLHLYNVEKNEWKVVNNRIIGWGLSCAIPVSPYVN